MTKVRCRIEVTINVNRVTEYFDEESQIWEYDDHDVDKEEHLADEVVGEAEYATGDDWPGYNQTPEQLALEQAVEDFVDAVWKNNQFRKEAT